LVGPVSNRFHLVCHRKLAVLTATETDDSAIIPEVEIDMPTVVPRPPLPASAAASRDHNRHRTLANSLRLLAIGYLLVAILASVVFFVLHLRSAPSTGLHRTVHASASSLGSPLLAGPATDVTLDFVTAERDLPSSFFVVWRGVWYLPNTRTVDLRARADDRVTIWINGQRLLYWDSGAPSPSTAGRTLTLPGGFHSLAVEYEQRGGGHGLTLHGDGLKPHRLFRAPVGPFDVWLASSAAWTGAAVTILWLTLLVLACPVAAAALVLHGLPSPIASKGPFLRRLRALSTAARRICSSLWRPFDLRHLMPWFRISTGYTRSGRFHTAAHRALPFAFGIFLLSGVVDTMHRYRTRDDFAFGDWLINYQGGFVRRGLLGEAVYAVHLLFGGNPGFYVLVLQLALYSVFLLFSFLLLRRQNIVAYAPLVLVPFTFMYHDEVGFRKEQIFLTFMAISVWLLHSRPDRSARATYVLLLALYPAAVLSHEMLLVFLPYLLAAYALSGCWQRSTTTTTTTGVCALSALSVACFSAVILYGRTAGLGAERILESLAAAGYTAGGAIGFLNDSMAAAHGRVREVYRWGNYTNYLPATALVAVAFYSIRGRIHHIVRDRICLSLVAASIALSIPLFVFAHDWGRFIRIHAVALLLLSLGNATSTGRASSGSSGAAIGHPRLAFDVRGAAWCAAVLSYVSFWRLAPYGDVSVLLAEPYYLTSLRRSWELLAGMMY